MNIALTGGTGVLGGAVLNAALAAGHRVRALIRPRAGRSQPVVRDVDWIVGELSDPTALDELVSTADVVVHCAFSATDDPERFVQDNIAATLRLLTRTAVAGGRQFVFISSLAVYGTEPWNLPGAASRALDEDFPLWPGDFYGAHKLALEKMVVAGSGSLGLNTAAFRVGCLLGRYPDRGRDYLAQFLTTARDSGVIRTRMGAYVITASDAARIIINALGDTAVAGRVFNVFDRWMDFSELARPLRTVLGRDIEVACATAPAPEPAILNDRLMQRAPCFGTDEQILEMLRDLWRDLASP